MGVFFRSDPRVLGLVLFALLGSFMVSYGSAKAEALRVSVPPGWMRRAERAICLSAGTILVPVAAFAVHVLKLPAWVEHLPVLAAITIVAGVGNVSAIRRLRAVAAAASVAAPSAPSQVTKRFRPPSTAPREPAAQPELARRRA
jgi:CDP-diacylglycerol---glycerol-3-phosphate 3-phosphatidyltransferase